jgi:hypothetical protein
MEFWTKSAHSLESKPYSPLPRVRQLVLPAPSAESVARMPTTETREADGGLVLADCTITGDRGMLVYQAAEPDKIPVSPAEGIRHVAMRLCAILGMAMLITGGLIWFSGVRQSTNFSTPSDETLTQVAKSGGNVETRSTAVPRIENDFAATVGEPAATGPSVPASEVAPTGGTPMPMQVAKSDGKIEEQSATKVEAPTAENDRAILSGKPVATGPSVPASEAAPTSGTPTPMQVANGGGKVEVSPTKLGSPAAEKDRAATIGKPGATAPSVPAPEVASTGNEPMPTQAANGGGKVESPVAASHLGAAAPVASGPVPGPALATASATQLGSDEIAMLVTRGKDFLKVGDLASARLLFQRAATAGNAEAAFVLGTTFDPLFIRRMGVVGMEPDLARAREWYKRAAALGSVDASQQLATLQGR